MKTFINNIILSVICFTITACETNDNSIESYKSQYIEGLAKEMSTTKDLLLKDLDISIDSMRIIPITVADSIAILEEVTKDNGEGLKKLKKTISKAKEMEGLMLMFGGKDPKLKKTLEVIRELKTELPDLERATKVDLPRYKEMGKDITLANVFSFQITYLDSNKIHKIEQRKAVFNTKGKLVKTKCSITLETYLEEKNTSK